MSERKPDAVEKVVLGLFVGLVLKATLDHSYTGVSAVPHERVVATIGSIAWSKTTMHLGIFVITVVRFVIGAYRMSDEVTRICTRPYERLWNLLASVVTFILFYATGISIEHPHLFYAGMIFVHFWDFLWFTGRWASATTSP